MKVQNTPQKFLNNKETVRIEDCLKRYYISQWDYWNSGPLPMQFPQEYNAGKRKSHQTQTGIVSWKEISQF